MTILGDRRRLIDDLEKAWSSFDEDSSIRDTTDVIQKYWLDKARVFGFSSERYSVNDDIMYDILDELSNDNSDVEDVAEILERAFRLMVVESRIDLEGSTQILYPNLPDANSFAVEGELAEQFVKFFSKTSADSTSEEFSEIVIQFLGSWSVNTFKSPTTTLRKIS